MLLCFGSVQANAQLGFCSGNSGDPIFTETFGSGTNNTPLPPGTTTYTFANTAPNDGFYTVSNNTNWYGWHNTQDHTLNDTDGRSLIVNADFTAGEFYRTTINGLCSNTSYEFSSWLLNLLPQSGCGGVGIPINVKFEIWDNTDTNLLASGDTGNIQGTSTPNWEQYALVFQTVSNQTSVILKMINNGIGGCGNDLAIDDIVFKTCGDFIDVIDNSNNNSVTICNYQTPYSTQLNANPDFSIYSTHAYQWQESIDAVNWIDIANETNQTFITPALSNTRYYRVKVAEDAINLANDLCNTISDVFEIHVVTQPNSPMSNGDVINCSGETEFISVSVPNGISVNWYDSPTNGNLLLSNNTTFETTQAGTYYAEAVSIEGNCISDSRTAITVEFFDAPIVEDEDLFLCEGQEITLYANVINTTYLWNTGAMVSQISVDTPGIYTVLVTNGNGCSKTKTITLTQIDLPVIESVNSDGDDIVVNLSNNGDFEYSLDGINYQLSHIFPNTEGGLYTVYVKERNGCGVITKNHIHFIIPKFFTPNNDGKNDTFDLKGIQYFESSEVQIFNRFGQLLIRSKNSPFVWNGNFKNLPQPTSDYWYIITIESQKFTGHFTLKR